jgi:hypothetical protein
MADIRPDRLTTCQPERKSVVSRRPSELEHSICFSTTIFTITRSWHNRPGVAAVPIASQTQIKKYIRIQDQAMKTQGEVEV